jgi:protein TonB
MLTVDRKERLTSLAGVLVLHLLLGWALLLSLAPALMQGVSESLDVFNVPQVPPPPLDDPEPALRHRPAPAPREPAAKSAPPRPRTEQPPVVAPKSVREVPPPVAAGMVPASGGETRPIGSERPGTGTGTGGSGRGSGSGGSGSGTGGGGAGGSGGGGSGSGGVVARAQLRSGSIGPRDYPRAANGHQGIVEARLTVSAGGAVTGCRVARSSGNAVLDATTCRLIRERFHFSPARDAQGNPVPDVKGWQQRWWRD